MKISAALKQKFPTVFNYRDGESIQPGKPWLEEIFTKLSTSPVGV